MTNTENIITSTVLIKQKLSQLLDERKISHRAASLYIGKSESYINKFIKDPTPERLEEVDRLKLSKLLQVDEQELTDIDLSKNRDNQSYNQEILAEILEAVEECLAEHGRRLSAQNRIKIIFSVYNKVLSLPKEERKAQVKFLTDYVYDTLKSA